MVSVLLGSPDDPRVSPLESKVSRSESKCPRQNRARRCPLRNECRAENRPLTAGDTRARIRRRAESSRGVRRSSGDTRDHSQRSSSELDTLDAPVVARTLLGPARCRTTSRERPPAETRRGACPPRSVRLPPSGRRRSLADHPAEHSRVPSGPQNLRTQRFWVMLDQFLTHPPSSKPGRPRRRSVPPAPRWRSQPSPVAGISAVVGLRA
jgi:hypothetical protein